MTELLAILTNTRRIKAALKVLPLEEAKLIGEKVAAAIAQLEEDAQDDIRKDEERKAKIKEFIELLGADGLSPSDLIGIDSSVAKITGKAKDKRASGTVAAKYEWFIGSERETWSGRGRMPVELRTRIEQGAALESFLIRS